MTKKKAQYRLRGEWGPRPFIFIEFLDHQAAKRAVASDALIEYLMHFRSNLSLSQGHTRLPAASLH